MRGGYIFKGTVKSVFECGQKRDSRNLQNFRTSRRVLKSKISYVSGSNPAGTTYWSSGCENAPNTKLHNSRNLHIYGRVSPLEHLHVSEDRGYNEEDAHEDDVVGVDLLGGGRERTAVPPVGLSALARLVVAVRPSALLPVYRPESKIFVGRLFE